jgi:hypothetical protein
MGLSKWQGLRSAALILALSSCTCVSHVMAQSGVGVGETGTFYVTADANIRDRATSEGSEIRAKALRGKAVYGRVVLGVDGTSNWLELVDDEGFVGVVNLSRSPRLRLNPVSNSAGQTITSPCAFQEEPEDGSVTKVTLEPGQSVRVLGTVAGGRTECGLPRGGVGYRRSLSSCVSNGQSTSITPRYPPINVTYGGMERRCNFWGSELQVYFDRGKAQWRENTRRNPTQFPISQPEVVVPVNRTWGRLTINAVIVASNYGGPENGVIAFANPTSELFQQLRATGLTLRGDRTSVSVVHKNDTPLGSYDAGNFARAASLDLEIANGRSAWGCGV